MTSTFYPLSEAESMPPVCVENGIPTKTEETESINNPTVDIFDTTLRDGVQSTLCVMNPDEEIAIAEQLVALGVDMIGAVFAVEADVRRVECTINGFGEGAGNASLEVSRFDLGCRSDKCELETGFFITVNLEKQTLSDESGKHALFGIKPFRKHCPVKGPDDIGVTQLDEEDIPNYVASRGF